MAIDRFRQLVVQRLNALNQEQQSLAQALGMHPSQLSKVLRGRTPIDLNHEKAWLEALHITEEHREDFLDAMHLTLAPPRIQELLAHLRERLDHAEGFEERCIHRVRRFRQMSAVFDVEEVQRSKRPLRNTQVPSRRAAERKDRYDEKGTLP